MNYKEALKAIEVMEFSEIYKHGEFLADIFPEIENYFIPLKKDIGIRSDNYWCHTVQILQDLKRHFSDNPPISENDKYLMYFAVIYGNLEEAKNYPQNSLLDKYIYKDGHITLLDYEKESLINMKENILPVLEKEVPLSDNERNKLLFYISNYSKPLDNSEDTVRNLLNTSFDRNNEKFVTLNDIKNLITLQKIEFDNRMGYEVENRISALSNLSCDLLRIYKEIQEKEFGRSLLRDWDKLYRINIRPSFDKKTIQIYYDNLCNSEHNNITADIGLYENSEDIKQTKQNYVYLSDNDSDKTQKKLLSEVAIPTGSKIKIDKENIILSEYCIDPYKARRYDPEGYDQITQLLHPKQSIETAKENKDLETINSDKTASIVAEAKALAANKVILMPNAFKDHDKEKALVH